MVGFVSFSFTSCPVMSRNSKGYGRIAQLACRCSVRASEKCKADIKNQANSTASRKYESRDRHGMMNGKPNADWMYRGYSFTSTLPSCLHQ